MTNNPWRESLLNCIESSNYLRASEYRELIAELDALYEQRDELIDALRKVEAHHVELNRLKGRDESRSTTLRIVRSGIAKVRGES